MAAVAPAAAAASRPSRKGKKASEATTVPAVGRWAFIAAILAGATRVICPPPTPPPPAPGGSAPADAPARLEEAQVDLPGEDLAGLLVVRRGDDGLEEGRRDFPGRLAVQRPVEPEDSPARRDRVAPPRPP